MFTTSTFLSFSSWLAQGVTPFPLLVWNHAKQFGHKPLSFFLRKTFIGRSYWNCLPSFSPHPPKCSVTILPNNLENLCCLLKTNFSLFNTYYILELKIWKHCFGAIKNIVSLSHTYVYMKEHFAKGKSKCSLVGCCIYANRSKCIFM